jgi:hypothetical protein
MASIVENIDIAAVSIGENINSADSPICSTVALPDVCRTLPAG